MSKIDKKYVAARNKLIPFAEKYADVKVGKSPQSSQSREEWIGLWNSTFSNEMNRLVEEQRLTDG